jgi:3-oxoacyl-[acyl-carrier-protein] synthase II
LKEFENVAAGKLGLRLSATNLLAKLTVEKLKIVIPQEPLKRIFSMSPPRVVITGLGIVSPLGLEPESLWSSLESGQTGIGRIESIPTRALSIHSGAEAKGFTGKIEDYGPLEKTLQRSIKKSMKVMCREIEMGVAAAQKALSHSGLGENRDPDRCGCLFGCDYILTRPEEYADGLRNCRQLCPPDGRGEDLQAIADWVAAWPQHGIPKVNPLWLLKYLPNMPNSHFSIFNDFRGPNNAITVREISMHLSVAEASSIIQRGAADVMLVGATGSRIHPLRTTQLALIENLASEQQDPSTMARPFDVSCDGMVLGEGAGAVLLESLEHATARGAKIWGEVVGYGASTFGPHCGPDHLRSAIRSALSKAVQQSAHRLQDQWHMHAQGLSAPRPDASEAAAISDLYDLLGYRRPVTSAKSYFGHLGAGGSAVELIASLLAVSQNRLFPIRNLKNLMPDARWEPAVAGSTAGHGFVHSSYTLQGQAAAIAIAAA